MLTRMARKKIRECESAAEGHGAAERGAYGRLSHLWPIMIGMTQPPRRGSAKEMGPSDVGMQKRNIGCLPPPGNGLPEEGHLAARP